MPIPHARILPLGLSCGDPPAPPARQTGSRMLDDDQFTDIITAVTGDPPAWSWRPERAALRAAALVGVVAWVAVCARVIWLAWG